MWFLRPICWLLAHAWTVDQVVFIGHQNRVEKHRRCTLCGLKRKD